MITSVFKKSKLINFIFVFLAVFSAVLLGYFKFDLFTSFWQSALVFLVLLFTVSILYFIVNKNKLSLDCNYEIVLFSLFLLALPQVLQDVSSVISNLLVLLALRRILSLRSPKRVIKKVFDASLLITLASFFSFWAILFFPVVFFGLFLYSHLKPNYWLVPFLGVASVISSIMCCSIVFKNEFFGFFILQPQVSFNYNSYNHISFIVFITLLFSFGLWASIFFFKSIENKKKESKMAHKIILLSVFIAFVLMLVSPKKNGSEFVFLLSPIAILISSYIDIIEDRWFKELYFFMLIAIPFILLMF